MDYHTRKTKKAEDAAIFNAKVFAALVLIAIIANVVNQSI